MRFSVSVVVASESLCARVKLKLQLGSRQGYERIHVAPMNI